MGNIKSFVKATFDVAAKNPTSVTIQVHVVSNQKSGVCTFAHGKMKYIPGRATGTKPFSQRFSATEGIEQFTHSPTERDRPDGTEDIWRREPDLGLEIIYSGGDTISIRIRPGTRWLNFECDVVNGILTGFPPSKSPLPSLSFTPVFLVSLTVTADQPIF